MHVHHQHFGAVETKRHRQGPPAAGKRRRGQALDARLVDGDPCGVEQERDANVAARLTTFLVVGRWPVDGCVLRTAGLRYCCDKLIQRLRGRTVSDISEPSLSWTSCSATMSGRPKVLDDVPSDGRKLALA